MELVSRPVERAVRYIDALSRGGFAPTATQVDVFATADGPREATYLSSALSNAYFAGRALYTTQTC